MDQTCEVCGKVFYDSPKRIAKGWGRFCSKTCRFSIPYRFWPLVKKTDGCWIWTGDKTREGYGWICCRSSKVYAHRLAFELTNGPFDPKLQVCHKCDNPACVRPDHLFVGTSRDNLMDASAKGRLNHGEDRYNHKLTEDDVRMIRSSDLTCYRLSKLLHVTAPCIRAAKKRTTWKHVS